MKDYTLTFWETVKMRLYKRMGWAYRNKRLGFGFSRRTRPGIIFLPYIMETKMPVLSEGKLPASMSLKRRYAASKMVTHNTNEPYMANDKY